MTPSEALILSIYKEELWHKLPPLTAADHTAERCGVHYSRVAEVAQKAARQKLKFYEGKS